MIFKFFRIALAILLIIFTVYFVNIASNKIKRIGVEGKITDVKESVMKRLNMQTKVRQPPQKSCYGCTEEGIAQNPYRDYREGKQASDAYYRDLKK